jgi:acyl carrier protein
VTRKSMDSLDAVEIVMVFEEIFETELPVNDAESLGGPTEVVDWLELRLSNQRPNKQAVALLKKLANAQQNPELAEGLEGTWRREQIAAIIREILSSVTNGKGR